MGETPTTRRVTRSQKMPLQALCLPPAVGAARAVPAPTMLGQQSSASPSLCQKVGTLTTFVCL